MNKDYLIKILQTTNELYRITLLFPKKEPLRYKIRGFANDVLANFVSLPAEADTPTKVTIIEESEKIIEVIDNFLEVAKAQNWVKDSDILSLQREYSRMKEELTKFETEEKTKKLPGILKDEPPPAPAPKIQEPELIERQEKILDVLKTKGKAQIWEIKDDFPNVTKRTLRRDFNKLVKKGFVERIGEKNTTFYQILVKQG